MDNQDREIVDLKARVSRVETWIRAFLVFMIGFPLVVAVALGVLLRFAASIDRQPVPAPVVAAEPVPAPVENAQPGAFVLHPEDHAGEAAAEAIRGLYSHLTSHTIEPDSLRVIGNAQALALKTTFVGTKQIAIEPRHLLPADPNRMVVTGMLAFANGKRPFIAYMRFIPNTGGYETLDVDLQ